MTMDPKLTEAVREDIRCHLENGVDLNPYSTEGMRRSWQHGYDGVPEVLLDFSDAYDRGKLAAQLTNRVMPAQGADK